MVTTKTRKINQNRGNFQEVEKYKSGVEEMRVERGELMKKRKKANERKAAKRKGALLM